MNLKTPYYITQNLISSIDGTQLSYVVEGRDWSIKQDGLYITGELNRQELLRSRMTASYRGLRNQIVHFGSVNTFFSRGASWEKPSKNTKGIMTWFHINPGDSRLERLKKAHKKLEFIHTSSSITKNKLSKAGVPEEKLKVIPLGVDTELFKPAKKEEKQRARQKLNIPENKVVIGSFQKDGVGWGEGLEPKMVKGPDVFVETVEEINKKHPVFVLLAGPARGYVKKELGRRGIPCKSMGYFKDFSDVAPLYHALDLYLISSRVEGGPKAILEAWASGVPPVSTKVGMVPDVAKDEENVLLADAENAEELAEKGEQIIADKSFTEKLTKNALQEVQKYTWTKIAGQYYEELYKPLL